MIRSERQGGGARSPLAPGQLQAYSLPSSICFTITSSFIGPRLDQRRRFCFPPQSTTGGRDPLAVAPDRVFGPAGSRVAWRLEVGGLDNKDIHPPIGFRSANRQPPTANKTCWTVTMMAIPSNESIKSNAMMHAGARTKALPPFYP